MNVLHEMTREDRNASYSDTYMLATQGETLKAVHILEFGDEDTAFVNWLDRDETQTISIDSLHLTNTDLGMYVDGNDVYYVARRAERQWRRGMRSSTLSLYLLHASGRVQHCRANSATFMQKMATYFLEKQTPPEPILSRDFAFAEDTLFFRSIPVGHREGNTIVLTTPLKLPALEGYSYVYSG